MARRRRIIRSGEERPLDMAVPAPSASTVPAADGDNEGDSPLSGFAPGVLVAVDSRTSNRTVRRTMTSGPYAGCPGNVTEQYQEVTLRFQMPVGRQLRCEDWQQFLRVPMVVVDGRGVADASGQPIPGNEEPVAEPAVGNVDSFGRSLPWHVFSRTEESR